MKNLSRLATPFFLLAAAAVAAPVRKVGNVRFPPAPYPAAAKRQKVVGNVVLTGDIGTDGKVSGIQILASSSPLLDDAAVKHLQKSTFSAGTEDGKTVPLTLNAVVRFRDDRAKIRETGSMPAPILGNFTVSPADERGKGTGPEGFSIGPTDRGVLGTIEVDLPKGSVGRKFHVVVTDRFPGGKTVSLLDRSSAADGSGSLLSARVFRPISVRQKDEPGIHMLTVTIDGKNAGGARYRVAAAPPVPVKRPRSR